MKTSSALLATLLLATTPALAQSETSQDKTPQAQNTPQAQTTTRGTAKKTPDVYHATLDRRIADMHRRLHITPEQETAWNSFAQTMRGNADDVAQAYQKRAGGLNTMTAADNLHDYAQIEQRRADDLQKLAASFDTLYGQLSDQQKKDADAMFRQYGVERRQAHAAAHGKAK